MHVLARCLVQAKGLANKQIARYRGISESTVKTHISNVFRRIEVAGRTSTAVWARDHLPGRPATPPTSHDTWRPAPWWPGTMTGWTSA